MEYIKHLETYRDMRPSVVTLGKFDGVHLGHQLLMRAVLEAGKTEQLKTMVFTFDVSPQLKLGSQQTKSLMTNQERFLLLEQMGLDSLIECPFTDDLRRMEAEDFVKMILVDQLHAAHIVVGDDFRFGRGRKGDAAFLERMAQTYPFSVQVIGKRTDEQTGREISSSWVREELLAGELETVHRLLGEPYFILGEIVHGQALGRRLQIPTINQIPGEEKLLPPNGVYFSRTQIGTEKWDGITNIGTKPTVSGKQLTAETHLFACNEDLYGARARVELLRYHRPEQRFASIEALKDRMESDIASARIYFAQTVS